MSSISSPALRFENVVQRILEENQFTIEFLAIPGQSQGGFDYTGTWGEEVWAIEVKFYRTARAQVSLIEAAASRLAARAIDAGIWKGMLVVSCWFSPSVREALGKRFNLTFIDRFDLRGWTTNPELLDELNALFELDPAGTPEQDARDTSPIEGSKRLIPGVPPGDTQGTDLCNELHTLKRGRSTWSAYENLCGRILRYLFPNDLHGWHTQRRTDDGLNRFDYVCRIRPATDFWRFLIDHLNSRYVLFEFKNYAGKIKQGQVLGLTPIAGHFISVVLPVVWSDKICLG